MIVSAKCPGSVMDRYRGNSGAGNSRVYQATGSNYVSPHPKPGTLQDMNTSWDVMSTCSIPSSCANCFTHGCELQVSRDCMRKVSMTLALKIKELEKCRQDLEVCHEELDSCQSVIQNQREKAAFYSQELDSCYIKIGKLEMENKETHEKFSRHREKHAKLEERFSILEEKFNTLTQDFQKLHHSNNINNIKKMVSPPICNYATTEPSHNSWLQESKSMQSQSPNKSSHSWSSEESVQLNHVVPKELHETENCNRTENCHQKLRVQITASQDKALDRQQDFSALALPDVTSKTLRDSPLTDTCEVVKELQGDIFDMPPEYALAHCVGSDFIMSSGVAVPFRKKFRSVADLLDQNKNPGQVAFVNNSGRYIYYLVTKLSSTGKPKWEDFEKSVAEWRRLCVEHGVEKIAIPKIGCGRDQLDWVDVRDLLNKQFANTGIEITVCIIKSESAPEKKWNLKLCHSKEPLSELDPRQCALVFIATKDHSITPQLKRLAMKYGFMSDYCAKQWSMGSLYHYRNKTLDANIFGLVVKESCKDPVSFRAISKCLQDLKRVISKSDLFYIGFEAFDDPQFCNATRKVWTVITDVFYYDDLEVYFCWPEEVKEKCWDVRELGHAHK